jgi:DNA mismatch endonuclease (patch repair protein)
MAAIRGKNNKSTEMRLRMYFVRSGIGGWHANYPLVKGKPDFYFEKSRLAVFVDGCYWHGCPRCGHIPKTRSAFWAAKIARNKYRDAYTTKHLRKQGIKVFRFWEHQLRTSKGVESAAARLKKVL